MYRTLFAAVALVSLVGWTSPARAHCQVPCGIYDDHNRVHQMREDLTTIRKSMKLINELSGKNDAQSKNQLVRWVTTKEHHAERIMRTIAAYFMAQKIKLPTPRSKKAYKAYVAKLVAHHKVMVAAMKCKQSVDAKHADALGKALDGIAKYWPVKK